MAYHQRCTCEACLSHHHMPLLYISDDVSLLIPKSGSVDYYIAHPVNDIVSKYIIYFSLTNFECDQRFGRGRKSVNYLLITNA